MFSGKIFENQNILLFDQINLQSYFQPFQNAHPSYISSKSPILYENSQFFCTKKFM